MKKISSLSLYKDIKILVESSRQQLVQSINIRIVETYFYIHQDIGQMQMYVNYFDEEIKEADENKSIGIILCKNKKESIVKYTLPKGSNQIFTSKYKTYLPNKNDLKLLMEPENHYINKTTNE